MRVSMPPNAAVAMKSILTASELCGRAGRAAVCVKLPQPWSNTICAALMHMLHTYKVKDKACEGIGQIRLTQHSDPDNWPKCNG